jgi:hypothetical protein
MPQIREELAAELHQRWGEAEWVDMLQRIVNRR